jgi:hypothetical protein
MPKQEWSMPQKYLKDLKSGIKIELKRLIGEAKKKELRYNREVYQIDQKLGISEQSFILERMENRELLSPKALELKDLELEDEEREALETTAGNLVQQLNQESNEGAKINIYRFLEFWSKFFKIQANQRITSQEKKLLTAYHIGDYKRGYQVDLRLVDDLDLMNVQDIDLKGLSREFEKIKNGGLKDDDIKRALILGNYNFQNPKNKYSFKRIAVGVTAAVVLAGLVGYKYFQGGDLEEQIRQVKKPLKPVGDVYTPPEPDFSRPVVVAEREEASALEKNPEPQAGRLDGQGNQETGVFVEGDQDEKEYLLTDDKPKIDNETILSTIDPFKGLLNYENNIESLFKDKELVENFKEKLRNVKDPTLKQILLILALNKNLPENFIINDIENSNDSDNLKVEIKCSNGLTFGYVEYDSKQKKFVLSSENLSDKVVNRTSDKAIEEYKRLYLGNLGKVVRTMRGSNDLAILSINKQTGEYELYSVIKANGDVVHKPEKNGYFMNDVYLDLEDDFEEEYTNDYVAYRKDYLNKGNYKIVETNHNLDDLILNREGESQLWSERMNDFRGKVPYNSVLRLEDPYNTIAYVFVDNQFIGTVFLYEDNTILRDVDDKVVDDLLEYK